MKDTPVKSVSVRLLIKYTQWSLYQTRSIQLCHKFHLYQVSDVQLLLAVRMVSMKRDVYQWVVLDYILLRGLLIFSPHIHERDRIIETPLNTMKSRTTPAHRSELKPVWQWEQELIIIGIIKVLLISDHLYWIELDWTGVSNKVVNVSVTQLNSENTRAAHALKKPDVLYVLTHFVNIVKMSDNKFHVISFFKILLAQQK